MNQSHLKHRRFLLLAIAFAVFSSLAILAVLFAVKYDTKWASIPISLAFWLGLIAEQIFLWKANAELKKLLPSTPHHHEPKIGLIAPFATREGMIADIVFAVSFVILLILVISGVGREVLQYILLFFMVLSFQMHCFLNGKNFWYSHYLSRGEKNHG